MGSKMKIIVLDKVSRTNIKLPDKIRGQYSVIRKDDKYTDLIKIDAVDGVWIAKSNPYASLEQEETCISQCTLQGNCIYYIHC